jgi:hypothetical protein
MQTFLPSKDFNESAKMLDSKRLNKQILEAYQILRVLSGVNEGNGWVNHPAVKMWRGSDNILFTYATAMIREADKRGIKTDKNKSNLSLIRNFAMKTWGTSFPSWYTNPQELKRVLATHKTNLYIKDEIFYADFRSSMLDINSKPCCAECKYYWPTHSNKKEYVA